MLRKQKLNFEAIESGREKFATDLIRNKNLYKAKTNSGKIVEGYLVGETDNEAYCFLADRTDAKQAEEEKREPKKIHKVRKDTMKRNLFIYRLRFDHLEPKMGIYDDKIVPVNGARKTIYVYDGDIVFGDFYTTSVHSTDRDYVVCFERADYLTEIDLREVRNIYHEYSRKNPEYIEIESELDLYLRPSEEKREKELNGDKPKYLYEVKETDARGIQMVEIHGLIGIHGKQFDKIREVNDVWGFYKFSIGNHEYGFDSPEYDEFRKRYRYVQIFRSHLVKTEENEILENHAFCSNRLKKETTFDAKKYKKEERLIQPKIE